MASLASAAEVRTGKGTKALLFEFNGLNQLGVGGVNGGIGFRYYMQDGMALRPSVNFTWVSADQDTSGNQLTTTGVGGSLAIEKHLAAIGPVSPYLGIGAGVNYSKVENDLAMTEDKATSFSAFVPVGFEWAFAQGITLGGEYNLGYTHTKTTVTDPSGTDLDFSSDSFGIFSPNAGSLVLSVAWK